MKKLFVIATLVYLNVANAVPIYKEIRFKNMPKEAQTFFQAWGATERFGGFFSNLNTYQISCDISKNSKKGLSYNFVKTTNKYYDIGDSEQQNVKISSDDTDAEYGYFYFKKDSLVEKQIKEACAGKKQTKINFNYFSFNNDGWAEQFYFVKSIK